MGNKKQIKIFLIDENVLFRKGLCAILSDYPDFHVTGDAPNLTTGGLFLKNHTVDLVLIDLDLNQAQENELYNKIIKKNLSKKVVILTLSTSKPAFLNAIKSGINGFLLKNEEVDHLLECLKKINDGKFIVSESMISQLVEFVVEKNEFPKKKLLSDRELEVLIFLKDGFSNSQISKKLFVTENTIKTHIKHIYKKMSVSNREAAVQRGILWGILN